MIPLGFRSVILYLNILNEIVNQSSFTSFSFKPQSHKQIDPVVKQPEKHREYSQDSEKQVHGVQK